MKRQFIFLFLLLFLGSCIGSRKTAKIMLSGGVAQTHFYKEFSYEEFSGWIIIKAKINGVSEELNFLLDTGAPNVIKPSVAKKLGIKVKQREK